jgi:hypothetical protein
VVNGRAVAEEASSFRSLIFITVSSRGALRAAALVGTEHINHDGTLGQQGIAGCSREIVSDNIQLMTRLKLDSA